MGIQSRGDSTSAFCYFDVGCEKAQKAGENPHKVNLLRQYFVWYRTYGYFLGLISQPTGIIGEYKGYSRGSLEAVSWNRSSPERNAKIRDFLFGISEVITGTVCVYFLPSWEAKLAFGAPLIYSGVERVWESANSLWLQNDIALQELKRISNCAIRANA